MLGLAAGAAACGGDDDSATDTATEPPSAATATTQAANATTEAPERSDVKPTQTTDAALPATTAAGASHAAVEQLIEAAKAEGELYFYTNSPEAIATQTVEAFQTEFGIATTYTRLSGSDLLTRYSTEADSGVTAADLIINSDRSFIHDAIGSGWITPLTDAELPGGFPSASFPEKFVINGGETATVALTPFGLAYNTDVVDVAPTSWEDALDPANAGKVTASDPFQGGHSYFEQWDFLQQTYGDEFLEAFRALDPLWTPNTAPGTQAVASGEVAIQLFSTAAGIATLEKEGAPIDFVVPTPTMAAHQFIGISVDAEHPSAARLFAYWLLSEEGSAVFNSQSTVSPYKATDDSLVLGRSDEAATDEVRAHIGELLDLG